ncbi:MAG: ATP-binding protein [Saprospiraceae bacterium]
MIHRDLTPVIQQMATKMPVISITGPRQSGKTTLARHCFPDYTYVNLESPETRLFATEDPKAFLQQHKTGLIIDEAQRVPELFSYLQVISDASGQPGEYILSGSQNFMLLRSITQTLAGRVFLSHLLPFAIRELKQAGQALEDADQTMVTGFYPRLFDQDIPPNLFYPSYVQTYLERDIADLVSARNLLPFRKFMQLLAGRIGQLINFSSLGIEVGVDHKTIQSWCSLLEAGFIIYFARPYHRNFAKRIVKTPKVYFHDTGLAAHLLGITSAADLTHHWTRGALFENLVMAETLKTFYNVGAQPPVYFWRDNKGLEIDLIVETGTGLTAVEIKSGTTVTPSFLTNLRKFDQIADIPLEKMIVYGGNDQVVLNDIQVIPWRNVSSIL